MIDQRDIERILGEASRLEGYGDCLFRHPCNPFVGRGVSVHIDGVSTPMQVHQALYRFYHGPIPPKMVVRHRCGYQGCCNYEHLCVGTQGDNNRDSAFHYKYGRGVLAPVKYD